MRLLLDSHIFLWALAPSKGISVAVQTAIQESQIAYVSTASLWELTIKNNLGKLILPDRWMERLEELDFEELPIKRRHLSTLQNLPHLHRDPFDRLLIAQAQTEGLTLVTRDPHILKYPIATLAA